MATRDPLANGDVVGVCQSSPPYLAEIAPRHFQGMFPRTHEDRYCGAWEPMEDDDGPDDGDRVVIPLRPAA